MDGQLAVARNVRRWPSMTRPTTSATRAEVSTSRQEEAPEVADATVALHTGDCVANRYRLFERIGQGGLARVYRAHDLLLDRAVAVKVIDGQPNDGAFEQTCVAEA